MNLTDLLHNMAHRFPGGVSSLEHRLGYKPNTLQNKLNPHNDANLFAREIEPIVGMLNGDMEIAMHFAGKAGCVVFKLAEKESSDIELLDAFARVLQKLGEFSGEFQKDYADGCLTRQEYDRIVKESDDVIARLLELRSRMEQMVR